MKLDFQSTEIVFQSRSNSELRRSYFIFKLLNHPFLVKWGSRIAKLALFLHLPVKPLIRYTIFKQFCGGETLEQSFDKARDLSAFNVGSILDVAVEGSQTEGMFETTLKEILGTIEVATSNSFLPFSVFKMTGICRFALLEKIQNKKSLTPLERAEWELALKRVQKLCEKAAALNVRLLIDAEESWIQDGIDILANQMMEKFNKKEALIYNTVQLYRKDRLEFLNQCIQEAKNKGYRLGVKLVRGAYLEKERKRAFHKGCASPVFETKEETDLSFDAALKLSVKNINHVSLMAGTHNEASTQLLIDLMEEEGIERKDPRIYFSQLFGMSDHLSFHLALAGYCVAKYLPFGEVRILLPYLIRRAQENTSVHGQTPRELQLLRKELIRRKALFLPK